MVKPPPDPTSSIYAFMACQLRFMREQRRLTQAQVGKILTCSVGQVSKYETGAATLGTRECEVLDASWKLGNFFRVMLGFAQLGTDPNWPRRLVRFQKEALVHRIFVNNIVPMPFQTEEYARSLFRTGHAGGVVQDLEAELQDRMALQTAMLAGDPQIWLILDEVALRSMCGPESMAAQLDHLIEMQTAVHISVRVLPNEAMPHLGVDGSFVHFELPGRREAAFAGTTLDVGRVMDDQAEAARVRLRFERIAAKAWSENQSLEFLTRMRGDLDQLAEK